MENNKQLEGEEIETVVNALTSGFKINSLRSVIRFGWGVNIDNYIDVRQGFKDVVFDFVTWADERGKARDLILLAHAKNPGNELILDALTALGLDPRDAIRKYSRSGGVKHPESLESLVNKSSKFIDYGQFLERFLSIGDRVCNVKTPYGLGSGFLIGPDLVLTNFHVIEKICNSRSAEDAICVFDYRSGPGAATGTNCHADEKGRLKVQLHREWFVAGSPYSDADRDGLPNPDPAKLDYAVIRLCRNVGAQPSDLRQERGWFSLSANRVLLALNDYVVIPQHAQGRALEVAWGSVLNFDSSLSRVRYDTSTEPGSSGSPCLNINLDVFGLHQSSGKDNQNRYNQAVPLDLIARDLLDRKHLSLNF